MKKVLEKEDIASRGMAKYVYGFSSDAVHAFENEDRPKVAPLLNGSDPSAHGSSFLQKSPNGDEGYETTYHAQAYDTKASTAGSTST